MHESIIPSFITQKHLNNVLKSFRMILAVAQVTLYEQLYVHEKEVSIVYEQTRERYSEHPAA